MSMNSFDVGNHVN